MTNISERITQVKQRIAAAATSVNRNPGSIKLLAISKTRPVEDIRDAIETGQLDFGENYLQDALPKISALKTEFPQLCWHFIGAIQSNKTRDIASQFDWVHTLERFKIAKRLSTQRPDELPPLQVCIQVNISNEASKAGIPPSQVKTLAEEVISLPRLKLRGLMAIPASSTDTMEQRQAFAQLKALYQELNQQGFDLDTLSMGMSNDLEAAITEGSTLLRIGSAIFGARA